MSESQRSRFMRGPGLAAAAAMIGLASCSSPDPGAEPGPGSTVEEVPQAEVRRCVRLCGVLCKPLRGRLSQILLTALAERRWSHKGGSRPARLNPVKAKA